VTTTARLSLAVVVVALGACDGLRALDDARSSRLVIVDDLPGVPLMSSPLAYSLIKTLDAMGCELQPAHYVAKMGDGLTGTGFAQPDRRLGPYVVVGIGRYGEDGTLLGRVLPRARTTITVEQRRHTLNPVPIPTFSSSDNVTVDGSESLAQPLGLPAPIVMDAGQLLNFSDERYCDTNNGAFYIASGFHVCRRGFDWLMQRPQLILFAVDQTPTTTAPYYASFSIPAPMRLHYWITSEVSATGGLSGSLFTTYQLLIGTKAVFVETGAAATFSPQGTVLGNQKNYANPLTWLDGIAVEDGTLVAAQGTVNGTRREVLTVVASRVFP
jgi:hypothetical protein